MQESEYYGGRRFFLLIMIILLALSNLFGAFKLLTSANELQSRYSLLSEPQIQMLAAIPVVSVIALIAIWFKKIWGVAVVSMAFVVVVVLDLSFGVSRHLLLAVISYALLMIACYLVRADFKR
jgi:hypothetical protein